MSDYWLNHWSHNDDSIPVLTDVVETWPRPYDNIAIADAQARCLLVVGQHRASEQTTKYTHPHLNTDSDS